MLKNDEALISYIHKLNALASNCLIVVEGQRDAAALRPLLKAELFILNKQKRSLYEVAEQLAKKNKMVILLLDADSKGREISAKLAHALQSLGVSYRKETKLLKLARVREAENLASAASELLC
ncbi:MAG: toprim domain-containing protein [Candidatus Nanoarchaeia archaeon]